MRYSLRFVTLLAAASCSLGSCSVFRSDVNSPNPIIAEQARRVQDLENQRNSQEAVVNSEKAKLKAIDYQIKSAKQELKARKQQVKTGY
ncbi:hypothetical protein HHL22_01815 [Hymenobacter sp. RP-2-7]|uniref:SlyB protein n=1 Tax=Hymenobacter polaris TaxID=2682546 RepID=A0A7Y0FKU8_9BACT|nr:hypothetical protein [Hymenobacter polaris]NML63930.1 hypothetical protein [Hymenobacter polaris]